MNDFQAIRNKKANFDYEILEKLEAGLMLDGHEVKSVRLGKANLKGSYVAVLSDGPYVMDMHIGEYPFSKLQSYNPTRKRKLLLNKIEIEKLLKTEKTTGLTIVPLSLFLKKGLFKLEIGIAKGKKNYDKRNSLKQAAQNIEVKRALKHF